jgi:hypothetical protein
MMRRARTGLIWLATLLLTATCGRPGPSQDLFPGRDAIPGWTPVDGVHLFGSDNLYELVDGQADSFFAYGFEQVQVQAYENATGGLLRVEVWQMDTASNAYGLYTMLRSGEPVAIGNSGDADPGRRVDFWQDRTFVRVFSFAPEDADMLKSFAARVSSALPSGGQPPSLIEVLPKEGLVKGSEVFFHRETSIQDYLWLGGQNLLSLDAETDGVLARYLIRDTAVWLLLVEYPDDTAAAAALDILAASEFDNMSAVAVEGGLLGAVFGAVPNADAEQLLMMALDGGVR